MRSLTEAEAVVISTLLAARPERERERLRQVGIPRSTYYAVRRRAYTEGWLEDRYVPDPVHLGQPFATFVIARPFADRLADLAVEDERRGPSLLWTSPQIALAVLFHERSSDGAGWTERWAKEKVTASAVHLTVDLRGPSVPVFFDFEGLWNHLIGAPGSVSYPHGVGGERTSEDEPGLSAHTLWALGNLLGRPFAARAQGEDGHQLGPFGLPYSERRLLARGWVAHRVLLNPARIPPYEGKAADRLFLITGAPRAGARPEALFARLSRECRVFPFLYVVGPDRWLIGAMGGEPTGPTVRDDRRDRPPVLPTVADALEGIEIFQEPMGAISSVVDHRYDRLVHKRERPGGAPQKP
ncbi:MAG: hypothetical protein ACREBT_01255 [Thermoplasmata archaeon]